MAITAALLTSGTDGVDKTDYPTASITPTANRLVLAAVSGDSGGAQEVPTLAGCGLTWVQVATVAGLTHGITVFRGLGASPTTGALTATFSATQNTVRWSVVEFDGIDTSGTNGSGAVVQSKTATATGTAGTADFDAAFGDATNNATYSAIQVGTGSAGGVTPEAGFAELHEASLGGLLETMWRVGEDQTPAPTWVTSRLWTQIVVEIKAAVSGATGTVAVTQDAQTSSASGSIVGPFIGTVAVSQAAQTSTASGSVIENLSGTVAVTQADQTSTATAVETFTGTSATVQDDQTSTATATLGYVGTVAVVQANQTSTASGISAMAITGTLAEIQDDQFSTATANGGTVTFWVPNPVAYTVNPAAFVKVGADDIPPAW